MSGWSKYPIGTKACASTGGYWERVERGWKWCTGATFPTPGGDVIRIEPPCKQTELSVNNYDPSSPNGYD